jgi:SAM-dependent methyltransferase
VLDVGSGAGDVAFLAAELVGASGEVVGSDRASTGLVLARQRAEALGLRNVSFLEGDVDELGFDGGFDAIVGRYVLMFQPDPAATLRTLVASLQPGGVVVFHEPDWSGARSYPPVPTYDRSCEWIVETLRRSGADPRMGIKLHTTFVKAGLPAPTMRLSAVVGGGANSVDEIRFKTDLAVTLVSEMERLGVATRGEVEAEMLAERAIQEAIGTESVVIGRSEIAAWSRP